MYINFHIQQRDIDKAPAIIELAVKTKINLYEK